MSMSMSVFLIDTLLDDCTSEERTLLKFVLDNSTIVRKLEDKDNHTAGNCLNPEKAAIYFRFVHALYTAKSRAIRFAQDKAKLYGLKFDKEMFEKEYDPQSDAYIEIIKNVRVQKVSSQTFNEIALGLGMQNVKAVDTVNINNGDVEKTHYEYTLTDESIKEVYGREQRDGTTKSCIEWTYCAIENMAQTIADNSLFDPEEGLKSVINSGKAIRAYARANPEYKYVDKKEKNDPIMSLEYDSDTHEVVSTRCDSIVTLRVIKKQ